MGRGEDDDFDIGVSSLGQSLDEGREVECELGVPRVCPVLNNYEAGRIIICPKWKVHSRYALRRLPVNNLMHYVV